MKLFLDDKREPKNVGLYDHDWIVVRSYAEAIEFVTTFGFPDEISFDHDLGMGETGLDFAHFLIDLDLDNGLMPANFVYNVHSANPVGRENIAGLLDRYLQWKKLDSERDIDHI
jgi:hypothetical protein